MRPTRRWGSHVSLLPGSRLGTYDIVSPIGAGGMGEVYRARDVKLGRDVAIKILPREFAAHPDRLARFNREARVLAAFNHPNIATIHGVEDVGDSQAIVMELIEGETLESSIARGPLPVKNALGVATQITEALDVAHEKGIIHRDLKPANIKITPNGVVKVLDFGLAKTWTPEPTDIDSSHAPTIAATLAGEGSIVGTIAYMSPEQARGQSVDRRTDIWAFGCVLFEMLAGRAAFPGDTISDTIAAILDREPDWSRLPAATPPAVRRLLRRCLDKDLKRRLRDVGDARSELEEAAGSPGAETPTRPVGVTRRAAISALAGATAGVAGTALFAVSRYRTDATPRRLTRFAVSPGDGAGFMAGFNKRVAISPDGRYFACNVALRSGVNQLMLRSAAELEMKQPQGVAGAVPFFSPDGQWLGVMDPSLTGSIRKVALSGGAPANVCRGARAGLGGATWSQDDTIYFVAENPGAILRVPASGGEPQEAVPIEFAKGERLHKFPYALPGGAGLIFTVATNDTESFDDAHIVVVSLPRGERRVLVEGGTCPCYAPSGHLVYARGGGLFAIRFDPHRREVSGQPFPVLEGVMMSRNTGVAQFEISASGDLAYIPGNIEGGARSLVLVDRAGSAERLPLPPRSYLHPRVSPEGRRLAIEIEGSNHNVFQYDFSSGVLSNITTDGVSHWPIWSPDGQRIGYRSGQMGRFELWEVPADRSRPATQIQATGYSRNAESYAPDGRAIAYTVSGPSSPSKVAITHLDGSDSRPLDDTKFAQGSPKFSPDGRWLAYCSNESGKPQVHIQAYPGPGARIQVSTDGGTDPVWRRSGTELFYRNGDSMMVVPVNSTTPISTGRPQELWRGHYSHGMSSSCGAPGLTSSNYDVTPDGSRFLMIKDDDQDRQTSQQIIVVQGWANELNRLGNA